MADSADERTDSPESVSFGFRKVAARDHTALVRSVFESVAGRYDLMNDLMSGGLHRGWKAALLAVLRPAPDMRLLDVAGGTGDVAFGFLERLGAARGKAHAIVCDVNPAMLRVGEARAFDRGIVGGLFWIAGDAAALPLAARAADACTIAFGLRNVTRRAEALAEMRRVLRPGGHFLCLEFSPSVLPMLAPFYDLYSFRVLPALGHLVARDAESYLYLAESIRTFPAPELLADEMRAAGFENVTWRAMSGGIVALHSGWRV
jgi:demethylmenaquinone methyltransferase/2-methoxy-6-polyprenyl-1,4-benzoquinol methylase